MNQKNLSSGFELAKKRKSRENWKFWLIFWSLSLLFLMSWFIFLEYKKSGWIGIVNFFSPILRIVPIEKEQKEELRSIFKIVSILSEKSEVQTFLILFQNNLELRPGGGYIGSFGILKIKKGKVVEIDVHDTNVFDDRISTGITPPYPMIETLKIKNWEMRDSNWSPDFSKNAQKAVEFYHLQGGLEKFDGVVAVSTGILNSFLEFTGPISIEGFPGEYTSENAIEKLEYQVEKGYKEQEIEKGKRKYIMKYLAKEILNKAQNLSLNEKKNLLLRIEQHFNQKDVMLNFSDAKIQQEIVALNWDGEVEENYPQDYLMLVDANLASYKTDAKMSRSFKYRIDFSEKNPVAKLEITYVNNARVKDWMTNDYQSYLRVYTPKESWLLDSNSPRTIKFGEEFNKKYFGTLVQIPINQTRTFTFEYRLPERITFENYNLLIQKQSGISEMKGVIEIVDKKGSEQKHEIIVVKDWEFKIK